MFIANYNKFNANILSKKKLKNWKIVWQISNMELTLNKKTIDVTTRTVIRQNANIFSRLLFRVMPHLKPTSEYLGIRFWQLKFTFHFKTGSNGC